MRGPHLPEGLSVRQIKAVPKIDDGAQHGSMLNGAARRSPLSDGPAFRPAVTVLPKVITMPEPVPRILAETKRILKRDDFFCDLDIAAVISDGERMRDHQRN